MRIKESESSGVHLRPSRSVRRKAPPPSRKTPPPPTTARARYDFTPGAEHKEELEFKEGDIFEIVETSHMLEEEGWCRARLKGQQRVGLAPLEYLELETKPIVRALSRKKSPAKLSPVLNPHESHAHPPRPPSTAPSTAIEAATVFQASRPSPTPESHTQHLQSTLLNRYSIYIPPCYMLIFLGIFSIVASLAAALWRSNVRNDIQGGFSVAQYILAVGIFVVGSMIAIHSRACVCWQSSG
ncbi:uncharacterized protein KY384_003377 [Bacidia gigantensis]|uniref:uncharacterized protein n=1 Tax=Bacidia gigantensis TaxID=2732470 RepID=UPI001D04B40B|nr:uncharacterized protein KY384_003377 [Bacidia gigantensis]KAG8531745.1 hypothetical protein KY384_003377 [Bacidia gigantensis]